MQWKIDREREREEVVTDVQRISISKKRADDNFDSFHFLRNLLHTVCVVRNVTKISIYGYDSTMIDNVTGKYHRTNTQELESIFRNRSLTQHKINNLDAHVQTLRTQMEFKTHVYDPIN